jgi:hypothetical protein
VSRCEYSKNQSSHINKAGRLLIDKGLEPKLHDLALPMGENKTLNSKDVTALKLLQDIMLSKSISSFV